MKKLAPDLNRRESSRATYQQILNDRAVGYAHQTALDRHPWFKGDVMDAVEDDLIVVMWSLFEQSGSK